MTPHVPLVRVDLRGFEDIERDHGPPTECRIKPGSLLRSERLMLEVPRISIMNQGLQRSHHSRATNNVLSSLLERFFSLLRRHFKIEDWGGDFSL